MKLSSKFSLEIENVSTVYNLLSEEDFDFKTKNISVQISKTPKTVDVNLNANSILDLKIGANALIKSLETIDKTLKI